MLSTNLLFYLFSGVLVFSAIMVVVASHSIFSLLFLVLSFLVSAFLLFMLECEFLALIFIVVYVGAIAVLFLFAYYSCILRGPKVETELIRIIA